jgi:Glycosyl hydrolase catalytic core
MDTPGTGADDNPQSRRSTGAHRAARPASARWRGPLAALAILAVAAATFLVVQFAHGDGSAAAGAASASPYPGSRSTGSDGAHGASPTASGGHARASSTATPSSGRSTPAHASSQKPAAPSASSRKGVSVWSFNGVDAALSQSGAGWYYTWAAGHAGITTPQGVDFVPMIWGSGSVTTQSIAQAKSGGHYLLGFNEPDMSSQSNMSVTQALDLWPKLQATGQTLGSPAVATGGATPGGWLDQFMSGAKSRGYRVDFIALHWYGGDFTTSPAVRALKSYLQAVWNRYHKPIWLTEYALINFSNGTHYPSETEQAAFVTASTKMLDNLSFLQRYAWFALPAADDGPSTGLFTSGPKVTDVGKAFEAAH